MIHQTIAHYSITEKLGEGGMGEVYLAEDTKLQRKVALKFLPEHLVEDKVSHKRFLREARSAAALDHPFICNIYEVAQTVAGQDFIVMEYVEGRTLKEVISEGSMPINVALDLAAEITDALEKAHKAGIVHRDLKPANIMLTPEGHAKVMDFGLAKRVDGGDDPEQDLTALSTNDGSTVGTLAYMAPEQLRGKPVDTRADIFSFGLVLFEMLTGTHPFRKANAVETTAAILSDEAPAIGRYIDEAPELLQHTIGKMLEKKPGQRYQSIHEIRSNLDRVMTGSRHMAPTAGNRRLAYIVLGLIVLAFLVGGTWFASRMLSPRTVGSVAVLPFSAKGDHPNLALLAYSVPRELINELAPLMTVMSESSSFRFSPSSEIHEVAQSLNVEAVMLGSLSSSGELFSVNLELVEASTGRQIWGKQYEKKSLEELIKVQERLPVEMASALGLTTSEGKATELTRRSPANRDAYLAYQEGKRVVATADNTRLAIEHFQAAISADPEYAPAYAALAGTSVYGAFRGVGPIAEQIKSIEYFANKALDIDPSLSEAHRTLGWAKAFSGNWEGAEAQFRKTLSLNPNDAEVYRALAMAYLAPMGRIQEAIAEMKHALLLDPESATKHLWLGRLYEVARSNQLAIRQFNRVLEIDPEYWVAYRSLGFAYAREKKFSEARLAFEKAVPVDCPGCLPALQDPKVLVALGETDKAQEALDSLSGGGSAWKKAILLTALGKRDEAFETLDEIFGDPNRYYGVTDELWMKVSLVWDPIRDDPRFEELLRHKGLVE